MILPGILGTGSFNILIVDSGYQVEKTDNKRIVTLNEGRKQTNY